MDDEIVAVVLTPTFTMFIWRGLFYFVDGGTPRLLHRLLRCARSVARLENDFVFLHTGNVAQPNLQERFQARLELLAIGQRRQNLPAAEIYQDVASQ